MITDGDIGIDCVKRCSELLKEWKFEKVYVYLIKTYSYVQESISCAFVRNSPHVIEIYNDDGTLRQDVVEIDAESFALLDTIDTISDEAGFMTLVKELDNLLMSINMGTSGNSTIKTSLVILKNRIISSKSNNTEGISELSDIKTTPNPENLGRVWNLYYFGGTSSWEKTLDKYFSWCSGSLGSSFDRKTINREQQKLVTPPPAPEIVELVQKDDKDKPHAFECPVSLDDSDNPVILVKTGSLFKFLGDNKGLKEALTNCPLDALNNPIVLEYMKGLLDNVISMETYKELIEHGMSDKSPLTREDIMGCICLGSHDSHVKFTNSVLRQCLTNGKRLGNVDLWFAVIYIMIAEKRLVPHLEEYVPYMREHMIYRLETSTTYMCLSGLPTYPTYRMPLKIALWSVLSASAVTDNPKHEPIRLHLSYASAILYLIGLVGLLVPEGVTAYITRLECLRWLLNEKKKGDRETIENIVKALGHNFILLPNGRYVFIDGTPTEQQIMSIKMKLPGMFDLLSAKEILYLNSICDTNKTESGIDYHMRKKPEGIKMGAKMWEYGTKVPYSKVDICEETCRPYYYVGGGRHWIEKAREVYGKGDFISITNIFGNYVSKQIRYPSKDEFLEYLSEYFKRREKDTLPVCITQFVYEVFEEYKEIMGKVLPEDFKKRWRASSAIANRLVMEKKKNL